MQARLSFLVLLFLALLLLASPAFSAGGSGPSGEGVSRLCEMAIDKAAGRYSQCLLKASAKFAKKKNQDDRLFARQMRCGDKFDNQVARAQKRYGEDQCTPYTSQIADRTVKYAQGVATEASGTPALSFLFVQNGTGGTLTDSTLTLTGANAKTGYFTDRPYREAGQISTFKFLGLWVYGSDSFAENPPNADLTCKVDGKVVNYFLELTAFSFAGDDLIYTVQGIGDSDLPAELTCDGGAHLFIDNSKANAVLNAEEPQYLKCITSTCYETTGEPPECTEAFIPGPGEISQCIPNYETGGWDCPWNTTCAQWRETEREAEECEADPSSCHYFRTIGICSPLDGGADACSS
jgi:hypothetical protein